MKYSGGLVKKERELIFKLFLNHNKLKFNEIEKAIKIRSNMVSYHISQMQKEDLLEKRDEHYYLTPKGEKFIPIFPNIIGEEMSPLPVVLVALINENKILLIKRKKRPYQNYWSLIGGKMLWEETFEDASLRLIKEKANINSEFISINGIMHERVKGNEIIKHSFILFFTKLFTKELKFKESEHGILKWFDLKNLDKENTIPSDLWLIKNKLDSNIDTKNAYMNENQGQLTSFEIIQ